MFYIKKFLVILTILTILLLVSACANTEQTLPTVTVLQVTANYNANSTIEAAPTMTILPIAKQTFAHTTMTGTPVTTQTPTIIRTLFPSLTYTRTLTPVPTLTIYQFRNQITKLLDNNAGCKLPCWWGIEPGSTSWDEARRKFIELGATIGDITMIDGSIFHWVGGPYWEWNNTFIGIGFHDRQGIVSAVELDAEGYYDRTFFHTLWNNYSPEKINSSYGPPTRVWVNLSGSETGTIYYWIYVFYDDLGLLTAYKGQALVADENGTPMYKVCPMWQDSAWLPELKTFLQSPESKTPLESLASIDLSSWKSIDEAAGITTEDFYNLLLPGNTPACFYTPQSMWQ